jgi:hypothetical protein
MQGSHAYLAGGHHLNRPEQQHLPESPTLNDSWNNEDQMHLKWAVIQRKRV